MKRVDVYIHLGGHFEVTPLDGRVMIGGAMNQEEIVEAISSLTRSLEQLENPPKMEGLKNWIERNR